MSAMFDVNYYATNFILSLPGGVINFEGPGEKLDVKDHVFLKNVAEYMKFDDNVNS